MVFHDFELFLEDRLTLKATSPHRPKRSTRIFLLVRGNN